MSWPDLAQVLGAIPWSVIGAVAAPTHLPERAADDLDILVHTRDAGHVERRLEQGGWLCAGRSAIDRSTWIGPDGDNLRVLAGSLKWVDDALARAGNSRNADGLPTLPLPHLVLLKLQSNSAQDVADIARILGAADEISLSQVRAVIARHAPQDTEDLEALIELGRHEHDEE